MSTPADRFSELARNALERSGWFPGRNVRDQVQKWQAALITDGFRIFPAAERVLNEFGGLALRQRGEGLTAARETFVFDPTAAHLEDDRFAAFSRLIKSALYPIGEHGEGFLAIAEDGRVFVLLDDIVRLGSNIEEALEAMIQGIRGTAVEGHADWDAS